MISSPGCERVLALGAIAGQQMEVRKGAVDALAAAAQLDAHDRVERGQRDAHVGRMRRDAVLAPAEHGVNAVVAVYRAAADPGLALVARRRGVAEVVAPRPLQQIAARRRHVADLPDAPREIACDSIG